MMILLRSSLFSPITFLDNLDRSPNTIRATAHHLKQFWDYLRDVHLGFTEIDIAQLAGFITWLRRPDPSVISIEQQPARRTNATIDQTVGSTLTVRQAERLTRYEQMMLLREQGMKNADIAAHLGITARTVQRWIASGDLPHSGPRKPRSHLIDPYKPYLLERWHQGCHNGLQLEKELRAKGYKGSQKGVYRYLETLEPPASPKVSRPSAPAVPPNPLLTLSVSQATWLFFRKEKDLKAEEQEKLCLLRQASPEIETAYQLVAKFLRMVRERTGEQLDTWLDEVKASQLGAFDSFVKGVQQDKDAVFAGLTLPWSNGPLEGNVNRLKLIKRSMYGRAEFNLLRVRVLSPRKKKQNKKKGRANRERTMPKNITFHHTTFDISEVA